MKFHHIGVAVSDIDSALSKTIGDMKPVSGKVYDGCQKATLCMCNWHGVSVELIEGAAVERMLENEEAMFKIYHVCFEVDSILDSMEIARKKGYIQVTAVLPAPLFDNRPVVFMMGEDEFLIEFLEKPILKEVKV